jgi:predicted nuclease of restriction endonuclease-like (RecB) superfamily
MPLTKHDKKNHDKSKKDVIIPVPPLQSEMDTEYFELRDLIFARIKDTRQRFIMQANTGMIELYWHIGNEILQRQKSEGWGTKVIERSSSDLKDFRK